MEIDCEPGTSRDLCVEVELWAPDTWTTGSVRCPENGSKFGSGAEVAEVTNGKLPMASGPGRDHGGHVNPEGGVSEGKALSCPDLGDGDTFDVPAGD